MPLLTKETPHTVEVVLAHLRVGFINFMQYRAEFALSATNAVVAVLSQLTAVWIVLNQTEELVGWSLADLLLLTGGYTVLSGWIGFIVRPSAERLAENIRTGEFDQVALSPSDTQVLALVQCTVPPRLIDVGMGVVVIVVAMLMDGSHVTPLGLLAYLVALALGCVSLAACLFCIAALAFWITRIDNSLGVFNAIFGYAGRWPISIYPGWLQIVLATVVPVGIAVTVPPMMFAAPEKGLSSLAVLACVTVGMCVVARLTWNAGVRRYSGASG